MAFDNEQRAAMRILSGIEDGTMTAAQSFELVDQADPTLVYLIFTWLRKRYVGHPNADTITSRLVAISDKYPSVAAKMKEGQADSIVEWFEDSYTYRDLDAKQFIELVVTKLES